jgi:hypothetical protein
MVTELMRVPARRSGTILGSLMVSERIRMRPQRIGPIVGRARRRDLSRSPRLSAVQ